MRSASDPTLTQVLFEDPPRRTTRGRPRRQLARRDDGYSEAVVRNLTARIGVSRVRGLIQRWRNGASDGQVARLFGVTPAAARRWRRAFGVVAHTWQPETRIAAVAALAHVPARNADSTQISAP